MKNATFPTGGECAPVNRLRTRGGWDALSSHDVTHLLLLLDPLRVAEDALGLALDFAKDRWARVTIMHGGRLIHPLVTDNQAARNEDKHALFDLICLYWQIKNRYENVTISHRVPHSAQQVLSEASESSVDLIVLPEALFEPFKHLLLVEGGREVLRSSQCPIVIIAAAAINSTEAPISDISWFR
jgi:nucleotide-binding universal stress UspA family protein